MLARHPDLAVGYAVLDGEQRRIPLRLIYARPAGGICASIAEMVAMVCGYHKPRRPSSRRRKSIFATRILPKSAG